MIPQENAVRQTPIKVVLAIATARTIGSSAGTSVPLLTALAGRGVLDGGAGASAGVGVMRWIGVLLRGAGATMRGAGATMRGAGATLRAAGVARAATTVPAGGVTWTPTFILKLLFPR